MTIGLKFISKYISKLIIIIALKCSIFPSVPFEIYTSISFFSLHISTLYYIIFSDSLLDSQRIAESVCISPPPLSLSCLHIFFRSSPPFLPSFHHHFSHLLHHPTHVFKVLYPPRIFFSFFFFFCESRKRTS